MGQTYYASYRSMLLIYNCVHICILISCPDTRILVPGNWITHHFKFDYLPPTFKI